MSRPIRDDISVVKFDVYTPSCKDDIWGVIIEYVSIILPIYYNLQYLTAMYISSLQDGLASICASTDIASRWDGVEVCFSNDIVPPDNGLRF